MPKSRLWLCGTMATDSQFMSWFDAFIVPSAFNWLVVRSGSQRTMGSRKHNPKTLCHCDVKMLLCLRSENNSGWLIDLSGKRNFHSRSSRPSPTEWSVTRTVTSEFKPEMEAFSKLLQGKIAFFFASVFIAADPPVYWGVSVLPGLAIAWPLNLVGSDTLTLQGLRILLQVQHYR